MRLCFCDRILVLKQGPQSGPRTVSVDAMLEESGPDSGPKNGVAEVGNFRFQLRGRVQPDASDWLGDTAVVKHFRSFGNTDKKTARVGTETAAFAQFPHNFQRNCKKRRLACSGRFRAILRPVRPQLLVAVHES